MKKYTNYIIFLLAMFCLSVLVCSCSDDEKDEIIPEPEKKESLRLISYNILEGMKLDKANDYESFVEWVNKYDPDILALQEANGFTQESLEALAKRFGHPYVITNLKVGDNYPVALTSKVPLEKRRRLTKHVSHGCIFASLPNEVNLVVTHLWPQNYWHEQGDGKGDDYRLFEINMVLDSTILKYPMETKWLLMGDFNSVAAIDKDGLSNPDGRNYDVHNRIAEVGFFDTVRHLNNVFQRTTPTVYGGWNPEGTGKGSRIDFIYGTSDLLKDLIKSEIIYDDFTDNFSDHYPTMIEFKY